MTSPPFLEFIVDGQIRTTPCQGVRGFVFQETVLSLTGLGRYKYYKLYCKPWLPYSPVTSWIQVRLNGMRRAMLPMNGNLFQKESLCF